MLINSNLLHIEQGDTEVFAHYESSGFMWTEKGPRQVERKIVFDRPYAHPPVIQIAISLIDVDGDYNQRLRIGVQDITVESFVVRAETWMDTRIARLWVNWLALGAVVDPEFWDDV